jgi:hypothetical protein
MNPDLPAGALAPPSTPAFSGKPLIELEDVTKTYRSGELDVEVLHEVSLNL